MKRGLGYVNTQPHPHTKVVSLHWKNNRAYTRSKTPTGIGHQAVTRPLLTSILVCLQWNGLDQSER